MSLPEAAATPAVTLVLFAGDQTLFQRADAIEAGWAAVQPFIDAWRTGEPDTYDPGGDGPVAAAALLAREGRAWKAIGADER